MDVSISYIAISFILGLLFVAPYILWLNRLSSLKRTQAASAGLIIAALIYIGFALFYGDGQWLVVEIIGVFIYGLTAGLALRYSDLWLVAGWGLHPAWDLWLHWLGPGTHIVPAWYAIACLSFDVALAIYLAVRSNARSLLTE